MFDRELEHISMSCFRMLTTERRWDKLNLVRVYTKPKGKLPDYNEPVVLRSTKCTVEDFVSNPSISASFVPLADLFSVMPSTKPL